MIPENRLSTTPVLGTLLGGRNSSDVSARLDREEGGIALQDPSQGLTVQVWTARVSPDDTRITLEAPNTPVFDLIIGVGISECSVSFDQNMNPTVAYVEAGLAKLYWFDPTLEMQVTTTLASDVRSPRVTLDDKHRLASASSDVILAYLRGDTLYYRQQRDRYGVERMLGVVGGTRRLRTLGLSTANRLQFHLI